MTDYHQESGRAGRQGEASTVTTIVTEEELRRLAPYLETADKKGEMHALTRFLTTAACRQKAISTFFDVGLQPQSSRVNPDPTFRI